jgi:hypothetical protein
LFNIEKIGDEYVKLDHNPLLMIELYYID